MFSDATYSTENLAAYPSFYWIPSQANFPGIDSVLVDSKNVYALQATAAGEHVAPVDGLREIWEKLDRDVRETRGWHVVVVAEKEGWARKLVDDFVRDMQKFTLGRKKIPVEVWGCVIPPDPG